MTRFKLLCAVPFLIPVLAYATGYEYRLPISGAAARQVAPEKLGTVLYDNGTFAARRWADGSIGSSCFDYRAPNDADLAAQAVSDLYWVQPVGQAATAVFCDQATDGGGWTAVFISNNNAVWNPGPASRNWVREALGSPYSSPTSVGQMKLSDDFINALLTSVASPPSAARYRLEAPDLVVPMKRFTAFRTFSMTTCLAGAATDSWTDLTLTSGYYAAGTSNANYCGIAAAKVGNPNVYFIASASGRTYVDNGSTGKSSKAIMWVR